MCEILNPMANRPHSFKDSDIQRIVKAARRAGLDPKAVQVDLKNQIIKVIGGELPTEKTEDDLDRWMAKRANDASVA
jgi:hypothetical protein